MASLFYISAFISSLFRFLTYVFLRVIPTRLGKPILPGFYLAYLISLLLCSPDPPHDTNVHHSDDKQDKPAIHLSSSSSRLKSALTVLFSFPTSSKLQWVNIAVNTVLLLAAADFAVTPFLDSADDVIFTRVGALYPDSAKIVVRYPLSNNTEDQLVVIWRETRHTSTEVSWTHGPLVTLKHDFDWVDTVKLENLWPETSYEYRLATLNGTTLPYPHSPIRFRTFPDPRLQKGSHFRFVVSSCITPNFPYMGPFHRTTIKGFDFLANYLRESPDAQSPQYTISSNEANATYGNLSTPIDISVNPPASILNSIKTEFMLFLGDFIYADVPLYIGDDRQAYRRLYRRNYQSKSFRKIYELLPIFHTYDDHEIINNYAGDSNDSTSPFLSAADPFKIYNADANYDSPALGQFYYDFQYGDVVFFVMDTRRYRSHVEGTDFSTRTMLGGAQLTELYKWLSRVNGTSTFKFIVSSVPFTSLWGHDAVTDSWAGFPTEKAALLDAFHSVPNVFILSGDRHEFAAIEFNTNKTGFHNVYEFSTSPLNMFYVPFVRTLRMQSDEVVRQRRTVVNKSDSGIDILSIEEDKPREKVLKYLPSGNSKWSSIEIDSRDVEKPVLRLETIIDGKLSYKFEISGVPVNIQPITALSTFVPGNVKDFISKIGINPKKWF